jgi:1-acyl-sn-glycerol-3-phosphate acyltransferase
VKFGERIRRETVWWLVTRGTFALLSLCARVRVKFYGKLPSSGFILATNHVSHFDPPLITYIFPRRIDWIAVKELFHGRFLTTVFESLNVIPVDRSGADRNALRTATKRLNEGRVVGIFPEGGIRDGAASLVNGAEMKGGAALLAVLSKAPVVPGVILGSDRIYNKRRWLPWRGTGVWIAFGDPIEPPIDCGGDERRAYIERELHAAYPRLKDLLQKDFALTADDLPHSPQERMREP